MSSKNITEPEFEALKQALIRRRTEKGDQILGAQLGQAISKAVAPRLARELPNLRDLVETELSSIVEIVPNAFPNSDVQYRIIADRQPTSLQREDLKSVEGPALWKFFSNPNQSCSLAIDTSSGLIYVAALRANIPFGLQKLDRMDSEDYRVLAKQFAAQQDSPLRERLDECLAEQHFYDFFIDALRSSPSTDRKLLKLWESIRTEHVIKRLGERLTSVGVPVAMQAEIISAARPRKKSVVVHPSPEADTSSASIPQKPDAHNSAFVSEELALERLRELVHASVDRMSFADLREMRIPAGILLDAIQQMRS